MNDIVDSRKLSKPFDANMLKWLAIICMIIDHVAWTFVPTFSVLGQVMHALGRFTAPIMCFFLAEGFYYTKNIKKYLLRLLIFALISWIPFSLLFSDRLLAYNLGMMFSLFLALLALMLCKSKKPLVLKILGVIGLCFLSFFGDWPIYSILFVLSFGLNRGSFKKQVLFFSITSVLLFADHVLVPTLLDSSYNPLSGIYLIGVFAPLPLLYLYNGKRGGEGLPPALNKWAFYVAYPLHLLIIWAIKQFIF